MTRTYNRQPISVSTSSKDYPEQHVFTQVEFKGLCDDKNDSTVDQSTFASVNNMLVDDDGLLISRPPLKSEGISSIENEWQFGDYVLRYVNRIDPPTFGYLTCVSHDMIPSNTSDKRNKLYWLLDSPPDLRFVQIEDKIFIWIGKALYALNTSGEDGKLYFEDAKKYIYVPITKQVVNGIEQDFESPNFMTNCYIKRHLYNATSSVNERELENKDVVISYNDKPLYTEKYNKELLYFPSIINDNEILDIVGTTILSRLKDRYYVTFGTNIQRELPYMDDIVYGPILTRDGLNVIVFTHNGILKCELVVQGNDSETFTWKIINTFSAYCIYGAYFLTDDLYAFTYFSTKTDNTGGTNVYYHYPIGTNTATGSILLRDAFAAPKLTMECNVIENMNICNIFVLYERSTGTVRKFSIGAITIFRDGDVQIFGQDYNDICHIYAGKKTAGNTYLSTPFENIDLRALSISYISEDVNTRTDYIDIKSNVSIAYASKVAFVAGVDGDDNTYADFQEATSNIQSYDISLKYYPESKTYSSYSFVGNSNDVIGLDDANIFKLSTEKLVTDKYIYTSEIQSYNDRFLNNYVAATFLKNRDKIGFYVGDEYKEYFIAVTDDIGMSLKSSNIIRYGDTVVLSEGNTDIELLSGSDIEILSEGTQNNAKYQTLTFNKNNRFVLTSNEKNVGDRIKYGDEVKFTPYSYTIELSDPKICHYYHSYLFSSNYSNRITIKADPIFSEQTAVVNEVKRVIPLNVDTLQIGNRIYTREFLSANDFVTIDEMLDADSNNITEINHMTDDVPTLSKSVNEHYLYFIKDGKNLLEITSTQRNENAEFLLYLPKSNEQVFSNTITNMHPLSENTMAIFTPRDIWYSTFTTTDEGVTLFYKPVLSKLPMGCREGNEVITALDGSAIIFPTERGIAAMSPEQFVATTEPTLSYLSDTIQDKYYHFYNDNVKNFSGNDYKPDVKIMTYRYWILFYKYMDREILALDTRSATWWAWSVPYPIKKLVNDGRLHLLLNVKGLDFDNNGTRFLWSDRECTMYLNDKDFPELQASGFKYKDDVLSNSFTGDYEEYYENEYVGTRKVAKYASPIIHWHFVSPKLHFGAINNYKAVKGINLNVKGMEALTAKLSTKTFRDTFHPEKSETMEININDLRTFVKRLNLSHVTNFQYRLENDANNDAQHQLKLNFLCIKFEVKEKLK